ncbi:MAG: hypothetical protein ACREET_10335 [Stellaceae bacterium]
MGDAVGFLVGRAIGTRNPHSSLYVGTARPITGLGPVSFDEVTNGQGDPALAARDSDPDHHLAVPVPRDLKSGVASAPAPSHIYPSALRTRGI